MIPIQHLLNRICWDQKFTAGDFSIGHFDRVANAIICAPFSQLQVDPDNHAQLQLTDKEGATRTLPLHRVREVLRDGELIWQRDAGANSGYDANSLQSEQPP